MKENLCSPNERCNGVSKPSALALTGHLLCPMTDCKYFERWNITDKSCAWSSGIACEFCNNRDAIEEATVEARLEDI